MVVVVASLLITFMDAKVWPADHWHVSLPDEPGSSLRTTPSAGYEERFVLRLRAVVLRAVDLRAVVLRALLVVLRAVPPAWEAVDFVAFRARLAAPFFAAALRLVAARLRVPAAFFPAALRVPAPPMSRRFSMVSAAARRSAITRRPSFSALPRASRPPLSTSDRARATRLRSPCERREENKSELPFLAMCAS